jgi:hypothetical protein
MGINVSLYKSLTFGVSALYTGVAGALGAIAIAFRRARQLHLLARGRAVRRPRGRRRRVDPGTIVGGFFVLFVPNIAEHFSKGSPARSTGSSCCWSSSSCRRAPRDWRADSREIDRNRAAEDGPTQRRKPCGMPSVR